ncbi:hypothetical protein [Sodalis sp. dw_96]|uniref:hypothetical protein n=1 Tax=Sodalis sp. dw_96 TaxID=2719794 RepID=UPI002105526C|nr:hypothetical protein [Sodalis sp. dw_96]
MASPKSTIVISIPALYIHIDHFLPVADSQGVEGGNRGDHRIIDQNVQLPVVFNRVFNEPADIVALLDVGDKSGRLSTLGHNRFAQRREPVRTPCVK